MADKLNPFQPSTSPWDQSFTAGGNAGSIIFPSAVPPNASPLVPIVQQMAFNTQGVSSPPAVPSFWDATVIQVPFNAVDGSGLWVDQKFGATSSVSGTATVSTAQSIFYGASTKVDGTAPSYSGVRFATSSLWDLGASDFTIEGWFFTSQTAQYAYLAARCNNTGTFTGWTILINSPSVGDGLIACYVSPYSLVSPILQGTVKHNDGKWHHLAVARVGAQWSLYVDGVREASNSAAVTIPAGSTDLAFGGGTAFGRALDGYLSEWRIVNGISVYSGTNFTVPTSPFSTS